MEWPTKILQTREMYSCLTHDCNNIFPRTLCLIIDKRSLQGSYAIYKEGANSLFSRCYYQKPRVHVISIQVYFLFIIFFIPISIIQLTCIETINRTEGNDIELNCKRQRNTIFERQIN